jgi:hypothetical protein
MPMTQFSGTAFVSVSDYRIVEFDHDLIIGDFPDIGKEISFEYKVLPLINEELNDCLHNKKQDLISVEVVDGKYHLYFNGYITQKDENSSVGEIFFILRPYKEG